MRSFVIFRLLSLVFLFLFRRALWILRWSGIYWWRTLAWWRRRWIRWWTRGRRTSYFQILPPSAPSVVTLWPRSWWWSTFLLTGRLYSQSKSFNFFIMHFFNCILRIIVVLKFLTLKRFPYNETIRTLVLDAVNFSVRFKPLFQVIFCYGFPVALHVNFWIAASWHSYRYKYQLKINRKFMRKKVKVRSKNNINSLVFQLVNFPNNRSILKVNRISLQFYPLQIFSNICFVEIFQKYSCELVIT